MARTPVFLVTLLLLAVSATAGAATMQPTAPDKMTSPADKQKMRACRARAAAQGIPMDQRSSFVMDCMTTQAKEPSGS